MSVDDEGVGAAGGVGGSCDELMVVCGGIIYGLFGGDGGGKLMVVCGAVGCCEIMGWL